MVSWPVFLSLFINSGFLTIKVPFSIWRFNEIYTSHNNNKVKLNKHPLKNKRLFAYLCDASNEYQISDFFEKVKKKTKKIDALINNVGVAGAGYKSVYNDGISYGCYCINDRY